MSSLIDLSRAKNHLRVLHSGDDALIQLLINAAVQHVYDCLDRAADDPALSPEGPRAALAAAALLIVGDLYQNRESKQSNAIADNPTVARLLNPYRRVGV